MNPSVSDADAKSGACSYILMMLLQTLEAKHDGLIDELIKGASADQSAIERSGSMTEPVQKVFSETLRLLRRAHGQ